MCRRWQIEQLPPRRHQIPVAEAESDPAQLKPRPAVALLVVEILGIVRIDGVADQEPTGHGHRSELLEQPPRGLPLAGEPEVPAHQEHRLPSPPGTKRGEVGQSDIPDAPGAAHGDGAGRRVHSGHLVPQILEVQGVPTGARSEIEHRTRGQPQDVLLPPRPGLVREEELLRLHGRPARAIVSLEDQRRPGPPLRDDREGPGRRHPEKREEPPRTGTFPPRTEKRERPSRAALDFVALK